jgi:hypothetical protein
MHQLAIALSRSCVNIARCRRAVGNLAIASGRQCGRRSVYRCGSRQWSGRVRLTGRAGVQQPCMIWPQAASGSIISATKSGNLPNPRNWRGHVCVTSRAQNAASRSGRGRRNQNSREVSSPAVPPCAQPELPPQTTLVKASRRNTGNGHNRRRIQGFGVNG